MEYDIPIEQVINGNYEIVAEYIIKERFGTSVHKLEGYQIKKLINKISSELKINYQDLKKNRKDTHALIDIAKEAYYITCDRLERERLIPPLETDIKGLLNEMRDVSTENE
jgi:hypothetical protein